MFFEDIRSERQLMEVVLWTASAFMLVPRLRSYRASRASEPLPDHSSLTRIRERYGLSVFRRFFERIVEECVDAGLVWGEELFFFDATKVEANASMQSRIPRFSAEAHLEKLFGELRDQPRPKRWAGLRDLTPMPIYTPSARGLGSRASGREQKLMQAGCEGTAICETWRPWRRRPYA